MLNVKKINRRTLIQGGAAMLGAGMLGSFTESASESADTMQKDTFNVKNYGASGDRKQRATLFIRNAIDACTSTGGGTVYVPPGEYTVGSSKRKGMAKRFGYGECFGF